MNFAAVACAFKGVLMSPCLAYLLHGGRDLGARQPRLFGNAPRAIDQRGKFLQRGRIEALEDHHVAIADDDKLGAGFQAKLCSNLFRDHHLSVP